MYNVYERCSSDLHVSLFSSCWRCWCRRCWFVRSSIIVIPNARQRMKKPNIVAQRVFYVPFSIIYLLLVKGFSLFFYRRCCLVSSLSSFLLFCVCMSVCHWIIFNWNTHMNIEHSHSHTLYFAAHTIFFGAFFVLYFFPVLWCAWWENACMDARVHWVFTKKLLLCVLCDFVKPKSTKKFTLINIYSTRSSFLLILLFFMSLLSSC